MPDQRGSEWPRKLWREYEGLIGAVLLFGGMALIFLLGSDAPVSVLNYLLALGGTVGVFVLWWVGVGLLFAVGTGRRIRWRRRRTMAAAARRHPGAVLVPGYAGQGMYGRADARGVLPRSWRKEWESDMQVVLAVLPDRAEVWVHSAKEPLWSVPRVEHGVRIERVTVQTYYGHDNDRDELWFDDGTDRAGVAVEYKVRVLVLKDYPALDLEQSLREIGLSPGDLPRLDRTEGSEKQEPGRSEACKQA
ncbi:hypothetical protein [Promicromonospora panici]|uniref:hypothetical protein n=1 Tax=Promicromonospora panici TaxID=2219658 RepID=UPI00101DA391|nr:hypothetical protein [Promicromonospora panici]